MEGEREREGDGMLHGNIRLSLVRNIQGNCIDKVVSSYKESYNNKPMYGYMLPNLSPSPHLYKVQSVYNNNVAS